MLAAQTDGMPTPPGQTVDAMIAQAPLPMVGSAATGPSVAASNLEESISSQDKPTQQSTPASESAFEEKPTWQKSLIHVTSEGQDASVWIRDSELGTAQSQTLVSRLSSDFASMGMRLKGATVNGKPVYRSADTATSSSSAAKNDDGLDTPDAPETSISPVSTSTSSEQNHGA
jgi:hypothetical protein